MEAISTFRPTPDLSARPWAYLAPAMILLLCIPLLRPIHSPDARLVSDEERSRLATVQSIVERHTLSIDQADADLQASRERVFGYKTSGGYPLHTYSNQPPTYAVLLSGPYWVLHRLGYTFTNDRNVVVFWLTLLGVTLPVALMAGLVYRMGRIFELTRPMRTTLALAVIFASGLISYATVLNPHAPAAALLLAAATALLHAIARRSNQSGTLYLCVAGFCGALAAAIDPPAVVFLILFLGVIAALRWPLSLRVAGAALYIVGALAPFALHAKLNRQITGDLKAGFFHSELAISRHRNNLINDPAKAPNATPMVAGASLAAGSSPSMAPARPAAASGSETILKIDEESPSFWRSLKFGLWRIGGAFIGRHGVLSHFPIVLMGILGVIMIMRRHWPAPTKMLAGGTLAGALAIMAIYSVCRVNHRDAMFATRWFVVFLPLTLFWAGAWLRRPHRRHSWALAGALLSFSVVASLIGATGPLPREGFDRYTLAGAWHNFLHPPKPTPDLASPVVVAE